MRAKNLSHCWPAPLALSLLLSVCTAALAQGSTGGRTPILQPDSAMGQVVRTVYKGEFSYVRVERAEAQSTPSQHPVTVAPEALRAALAALRFGPAADEPLFNDDELTEIVPPLVRGLGELQPTQDLAFAVVGRHGGWKGLASRAVTTGRMFRSGAGLQLIVGLAQRSFESQYLATGYLFPFEPGRRAEMVDRASVVTGAPAGAGAARTDWVLLTLAVVPAQTAVAPAPASAPATAPAIAPVVAPTAAAAAPLAPATVAPAAPAAAPPSRPRDAAYFDELEYRLRALKRLRDDGLISEDEYQQKRREVLEKL